MSSGLIAETFPVKGTPSKTWKVGDQIKVEGKRRGSEGYVDIKFDVMIESKE